MLVPWIGGGKVTKIFNHGSAGVERIERSMITAALQNALESFWFESELHAPAIFRKKMEAA